jgi:hypothetical protein
MRFTARRRYLLTLLLLPGLLLRALVPAGFMPGTGTGLGVTLELCTAHGPAAFLVYPNGETAPAPSTAHPETPCAFAMTAVAAPPPAATTLAEAPRPAIAPVVAFTSIDSRRPSVHSRSPRGPPSLV